MTMKMETTIQEVVDAEREMVMRAPKRYDPYFNHALQMNWLLGLGMIESIDRHHVVFGTFISVVKKHLTLAQFSAVRLHHVQAVMNLRTVLEAGAAAAYAIANPDVSDFAITNDDGTLDPSQKLAKRRYLWLAKNYPEGSLGIKKMKDAINALGAHANIVDGSRNFMSRPEEEAFESPFFDFEDEHYVKSDLWQIANVCMGLSDLFYGVNQKYKSLVFRPTWGDQFRAASEDNQRLKEILVAELHGRAAAKSVRQPPRAL